MGAFVWGCTALNRQKRRFPARAVVRYRALQGGGVHGGGFQAAITADVFDALKNDFGCDIELFASPLNARFRRHCSAFPDVDAAFGAQVGLGQRVSSKFNSQFELNSLEFALFTGMERPINSQTAPRARFFRCRQPTSSARRPLPTRAPRRWWRCQALRRRPTRRSCRNSSCIWRRRSIGAPPPG